VIIKADENTNSLIITANKQDYQTVANLLAKIDIPKDQVYVEAYIVEMDAQKTDNWSFNLLQFQGKPDLADADANTLARGGYILGDPKKLGDITSSGGIFGFGHGDKVAINFGGKAIQVPSLLGFIEFIKQNIGGNVLSTPQILAMDNEEAFIEVGDRIPVGVNQAVANNGQTANNIQFEDATVLLKLKPFISPDSDVVTLQIEQKANDISTKKIEAKNLADSAQGLKKRTVHTNLTLKSGDTAVLGGLMQETDKITETKIPFLGDIPILGWLFKSRFTARQKTNLMVFLTPKIVRNSADHKQMVSKKFNERVKWLKRHMGGRDPFGEALEPIAKYAEAPDEFQLEDQGLGTSTKSNDSDVEQELIEENVEEPATPE
jgi:general secretion pathway protein D